MLFGNRFYSPPPFEVLDELSYSHLAEREIEDLNKVRSMFFEEGKPSGIKIRKVVNKYPTLTQFKMQWALLLGTNTKYTEAGKLLEECLSDPSEELSVRCALGALYRISDQKEKADRMVQDIIRNINDPEPRPLYLNHFEQVCLFLTQYFLDTDQFEKALEVYQWTITDKFYDLNLGLSKIISAYYVAQAKDGNFVYQPPDETYYSPSLYQKLKALKTDETKICSITLGLMEIIYEEIDEEVFKEIEAIPDKANDFAWLLRESLLKAVDRCDGEPIVHALTGMAHFGLSELLPVALDLLGQERDLIHNFVGYAFEDIFAPCLHPFVKDHYELFETFLLRKDADGLNQSIIMNMLCYKGLDDPEIRKKAINLFRRLLDRYQKENDIFRLSWLTSTLSQFRYTEFEEEVVKIWKTGILDDEIILGDLFAVDEIYVLMPYPVFESLASFYEFYQEKNIWYDLNDKEFDGNPDANILSCIMHNAILSLHLDDDEYDEDIYDDEDLPFLDEYDEDIYDDEDLPFLDEYDETFIPEPFKRSGKKIGRNDPCPCGSGLKYKKCCLPKLMN